MNRLYLLCSIAYQQHIYHVCLQNSHLACGKSDSENDFQLLTLINILLSWQGNINSQMLAQRQREILSQHLRHRQMHQVQQRTLMMRGQSMNMTPSMVASGGIPATMSNPRIPQTNTQQFPFPPNYGIGHFFLFFIRFYCLQGFGFFFGSQILSYNCKEDSQIKLAH